MRSLVDLIVDYEILPARLKRTADKSFPDPIFRQKLAKWRLKKKAGNEDS